MSGPVRASELNIEELAKPASEREDPEDVPRPTPAHPHITTSPRTYVKTTAAQACHLRECLTGVTGVRKDRAWGQYTMTAPQKGLLCPLLGAHFRAPDQRGHDERALHIREDDSCGT